MGPWDEYKFIIETLRVETVEFNELHALLFSWILKRWPSFTIAGAKRRWLTIGENPNSWIKYQYSFLISTDCWNARSRSAENPITSLSSPFTSLFPSDVPTVCSDVPTHLECWTQGRHAPPGYATAPSSCQKAWTMLCCQLRTMLCRAHWTMLCCTQWTMLSCTQWTMLSTRLFNHQYCYNLLTRLSNNDNNNEQACSINIVFSCFNNCEQLLLLHQCWTTLLKQ